MNTMPIRLVGLFKATEPWALAWFGGAPTHQPGFDFIWTDIGLGELGEINPNEVDIFFDTGDLGWLS